MSRHGPPPAPTALKVLRGNPGKRTLNKNEPQPLAIRPEMPEKVRLNARATQEWERLCPILERMKILTEADYMVLANLCYDAGLLDNAQTELAAAGLLIVTERTGMMHQNPLLNIVATTTDRITRVCREFGLTPSSRSSLRTNAAQAADTDDPWSQFG